MEENRLEDLTPEDIYYLLHPDTEVPPEYQHLIGPLEDQVGETVFYVFQ